MLRRKRTIEDWNAEDVAAWEAGGKRVARRNLIWSIGAEHIGFSIWSIWSVLVLMMPQPIYHIDAVGKFYLVAMPTLVGALMRIPYTVATARFGGRNWTVFSALLLLVPTLLTMYYMANPASYTTYLVVAAAAGVGGGNFSSSMTNINAFYPQRLKGWALGLNAGGGNIGVPAVQLLGLAIIAVLGRTYSGDGRQAAVLCSIYLALIVIAALGAFLFMDNLRDQKADLSAMARMLKHRESWVMSVLYIGTFGSFIGYSFAFGQILNINFTAELTEAAQALQGSERVAALRAVAGDASLRAAQIAFLGPLLGSLVRPLGGRLADRFGGGRITLYTFLTMALAASVVVATGLHNGHRAPTHAELWWYVVGFILLFVLSGIGNGSTYKMIPSIFEAKSKSVAGDAAAWSRNMSGALIGFAGALGAFGGVLINMVLRASYAATKSATNAFVVFLAFYAVCAVITWAVFLRRPSGVALDVIETIRPAATSATQPVRA
ncbi:nitrate/nitrite transporter [Nocardia panacis]|uniref:nitrate/nitrite transporter n=1 Tax=Nocardia panacis TaxID=2340916 RepID=UPI001EF1220B|nr:nitrate/nitrite transporter [Nocardia panacis]